MKKDNSSSRDFIFVKSFNDNAELSSLLNDNKNDYYPQIFMTEKIIIFTPWSIKLGNERFVLIDKKILLKESVYAGLMQDGKDVVVITEVNVYLPARSSFEFNGKLIIENKKIFDVTVELVTKEESRYLKPKCLA